MTQKTDLLTLAREQSKMSYSPYSNFKVGAAVEAGSGKLYGGTNIENASYGLAICAERVAIFKAISSGEKKIKRIAITCKLSNKQSQSSLMPCGACRQVISEFCDENTVIEIDGVGEFNINQLLPQPFSL